MDLAIQEFDPCAGVQLSSEQEEVFHKFTSQQNIFFTGSAGTGKSLLLRKIIQWCANRKITLSTHRLAITSSTGISSMNIGGSTIHSWASIGLGLEEIDDLVRPIVGEERFLELKGEVVDPQKAYDPPRKAALERWEKCEVLIMDEGGSSRNILIVFSSIRSLKVSMIDGALFDKLVRLLLTCIKLSQRLQLSTTPVIF